MYIRNSTYLYCKRKIDTCSGKEAGHEVYIETQGTIGTEDELTSQDIAAADIVIIAAADIAVSGKERFKKENN